MTMDPALLAAISALAGSLVGGISSLGASIVGQRLQARRERIARELDERERLYGRFIEDSAALFLDSLEQTSIDPMRMMRLFSLLARIRLTSGERVLLAAERVSTSLVDSYAQPVVNAREFIVERLRRKDDPLREFTEECRRERAEIFSRL